jgi:RHH-type proline utilization regulon transcriptional repressor/proline dehydrogenase/delta 1-pyrroline-5-carboxylate dehydrogenase
MAGLLATLFGRNGSTATDPRIFDDTFEQRVFDIGREFLADARANQDGLLSRRFWNDKLMDWSMKDEAFKVQLFRFVDAFPNFKTPDEIYEHLADFMSQPGVKPPPGMRAGLKAGGAMKGTVAKTMAGQITGMAEKFIAGTDAADAKDKLRRMWDKGLCFSVDLLGEACISDAEADAYQRKYLDLVENLPTWVNAWPPVGWASAHHPESDGGPGPTLQDHDHLGPIPRTNVSIKCSSLVARFDPIAFDACIDAAMQRIVPILEAARDRGVFINFDMESFATKDLTIELFKRCCETVDFDAPHLGLAMQAYLRSGDADAKNVIEWSQRTGRVVTVRLVKGAYWDYETIHAEQMGWPQPVWATKAETDACFERMTRLFIASTPNPLGWALAHHLNGGRPAADGGLKPTLPGGVKLAVGSHNVRSIAVALAALEEHDLPASAIELQMLYGMADPLKIAAGKRGLRVREYVPVGEMVPGMAYLVRRLLENTSNESWLKAGFMSDASVEELLARPARSAVRPSHTAAGPIEPLTRKDPRPDPRDTSPNLQVAPPNLQVASPEAQDRRSDATNITGEGSPFSTEPMRDFSDVRQRDAFEAEARAADQASFERGLYSIHLRRHAIEAVEQPWDEPEHVNHHVSAAVKALPEWRATSVAARAQVLVETARLMREARDELAGVIIKESGKSWREADADVCEAIDFCEFYARETFELFQPRRLGRFVGEHNEERVEPRGVCVVISPWNFPLAIACGMTVAAVVCGNPTILKPAEQTPGIAALLVELLHKAGVPEDVVQLVLGEGETIGAALARHPDVAQVAFTGSATVGREILKAAVEHPPKGMLARHVVCETGGKNAIIVDASADLDEAVVGVRDSAFGFAGQKCSACSRSIVVESIYETFVDRLVESTRSLLVGDPLEPATDVGPVIDDDAVRKITSYIERGKREATLVEPVGWALAHHPDGTPTRRWAEAHPTSDRLIPPHIFRDVPPDASIATDEIFGPVLAVIRASDFDHALQLALANDHRLTGGVYTRKPSHLHRARREFRVGNLYLNRGCTGALVARQPFGGFGLSGLGSKAGGRDYLKQFVVPRVVTENTMRRGFAPDLDSQTGGGDTASLRAGA